MILRLHLGRWFVAGMLRVARAVNLYRASLQACVPVRTNRPTDPAVDHWCGVSCPGDGVLAGIAPKLRQSPNFLHSVSKMSNVLVTLHHKSYGTWSERVMADPIRIRVLELTWQDNGIVRSGKIRNSRLPGRQTPRVGPPRMPQQSSDSTISQAPSRWESHSGSSPRSAKSAERQCGVCDRKWECHLLVRRCVR